MKTTNPKVRSSATLRERQRCIASVEAEPELDGPMPDSVWDLINSNKEAAAEVLRAAVRATKNGIISRINLDKEQP